VQRKTIDDATTARTAELEDPGAPLAPAVDGVRLAIRAIDDAVSAPRNSLYLLVLTWTFTAFNSIRVLGYLPTVFAIIASADSSQHSLWTWLTWLGANGTMAAWLYEHNGRRVSKAVVVNIGNTTMCLLTTLVILWYRN